MIRYMPLAAFVFALFWFGFVPRPVPAYLLHMRDAVLSGLTRTGELVYLAGPRTPCQHPACYHNGPGLFDIGRKAVYRYTDGSGAVNYATAYFDWDWKLPVPAKVELAYAPERPGELYAAHGGVVYRRLVGVSYALYYLAPVAAFLAACVAAACS